MDLSYTPKQKMIRDTSRAFSRDVLQEYSTEMDRTGSPLPQNVMDKMAEMNFWGIQAPIEMGGAGLDSVSYSIVIEEISRVSAATGLAVTVHNSVCLAPILLFGTEEQKERLGRDLVTGARIGGFTVTEPNAGSDAASIQTRAEKKGGSWALTGQKAFVTNGGTGGIFLVAARAGHGGNTGVFIVEKGMPGFEVGKIEDMMGMRGNMVSELILNDVEVPERNLLGSVEDGFRISMKALDTGRIGIASQALGIGMAAYEAAAEYATQRRQFGRSIGKFQGISFKLAEMKTALDASRFLIYRAASLRDRGLPFSAESAMCKLHASTAAMDVCREALQIFGGYGYVRDLPVERYFRDAKITEIYEGTSEVMKIIVGNAILREFGKY